MNSCITTTASVHSHINRSQRTSVVQKAQVDQNTSCAVLLLSVARLSSLLPPPTFSTVLNESSTSWSMCADCMLRLFASVVCNSEISVSDFSVALDLDVWLVEAEIEHGAHTELCRVGPRTALTCPGSLAQTAAAAQDQAGSQSRHSTRPAFVLSSLDNQSGLHLRYGYRSSHCDHWSQALSPLSCITHSCSSRPLS